MKNVHNHLFASAFKIRIQQKQLIELLLLYVYNHIIFCPLAFYERMLIEKEEMIVQLKKLFINQ